MIFDMMGFYFVQSIVGIILFVVVMSIFLVLSLISSLFTKKGDRK